MCTIPIQEQSGWSVWGPTSSWLSSRFLSCAAKFWRRSTSLCTSIRIVPWPCPICCSAMRQGWSGCSFPSTPWCSSFTWITSIMPRKRESYRMAVIGLHVSALWRFCSMARESRMWHLLLHHEHPSSPDGVRQQPFSLTRPPALSPHTQEEGDPIQGNAHQQWFEKEREKKKGSAWVDIMEGIVTQWAVTRSCRSKEKLIKNLNAKEKSDLNLFCTCKEYT